MFKFLLPILPTNLSNWLGMAAIPVATILFNLPNYLPSELWEIQSLSLLLARSLLAVVGFLLCAIFSLASIIIHHRKVSFELLEIKKYMNNEQKISFAKEIIEIQKNYNRCK